MKSRLYIICIIIILFIISFLQADFFYWIRILGTRPDFLLVICGLLGFYVGNNTISFWCSVFAGISSGSFSSCPALILIIIYTVSSFLGYHFRDKRYASSSWFLFFFSCLLSFVSSFIYFVVLFLFNKLSLVNIFFYFVAQCLFNSLIIYPFACLVRLFTRTENFDFRNS